MVMGSVVMVTISDAVVMGSMGFVLWGALQKSAVQQTTSGLIPHTLVRKSLFMQKCSVDILSCP